MNKGNQVDMFKVGERVEFVTNIGTKEYKTVKDAKGNKSRVFDRKVDIMEKMTGRIMKLHKAGRQGVAEIRPDRGSKKVSRKLQHVSKVA